MVFAIAIIIIIVCTKKALSFTSRSEGQHPPESKAIDRHT